MVNSTSEDSFVTLEVNGTKTRFKIDSGRQVNIIPKKDYKLLKNKHGLNPTLTRLTACYVNSIPVLGKWSVQIPHKDKIYDVPIIVADIDTSPILRLKTSADMHLLKRDLSISKEEPVFFSKFKNSFGELGSLPGYNHITMDPNKKPIISLPCPQTETKKRAAMIGPAWHNCSC